MKKMLRIVHAAVAAVAFSCSALADTWIDGSGNYWNYNLIEGGTAVELCSPGYGCCVTPAPTGTFWIPDVLTDSDLPVKSIGGHAFYDCDDVTTFRYPVNVTNIGAYAFADCALLETVSCKNSKSSKLISIGDFAFENSDAMPGFEIPSKVTTLGRSLFSGCSSLKAVWAPSSLIPQLAAGSPVLDGTPGDMSVIFEEKVNNVTWQFRLVDGTAEIYNNGKAAIPAVTDPVTVPAMLGGCLVTRIGDYAFSECGTPSITIPHTVTDVGYRAFQKTAGYLHELTFAATTDGDLPYFDAGEVCYMAETTLTKVHVVDDAAKTEIESRLSLAGVNTTGIEFLTDVDSVQTEEVDGIEWHYMVYDGEAELFNDWSAVIPDTTEGAITIPATLGGYPVTRIGIYAFDCCDQLTRVTIPATVKSIDKAGFYSCTALHLDVPETVTYIGPYAFQGCEAMANADGFVIVRGVLYDYCGDDPDPEVPSTVTRIGDYAFEYSYDVIENVYLPPTVTHIGDYAFYDCDKLESVVLQGGLKSIGTDAFRSCDALESIEIPAGVTSIGAYAFYECTLLDEVSIPASVTAIGRDAFYGIKFPTDVYVDSGDAARVQTLIDGSIEKTGYAITDFAFHDSLPATCTVTFHPDPGTLTGSDTIGLTKGERIGDHVLDVPTYAGYTFRYWTTSDGTPVTPDTIVSFDMDLYAEWMSEDYGVETDEKGIEWVYQVVDDGDGEYARIYNAMESAISKSVSGAIEVPATLGGYPVKEIGPYAFDNCYQLTSVTIPAGVTEIDNEAFINCTALAHVVIPDGVTRIGVEAFESCASLAEIDIPDSVEEIEDMAFYGCASLADEDGFVIIRDVLYYFYDPSASVTDVTVPDGVERIGSRAFSYCDAIESVEIPDSVTVIDDYAFEGCDHLTDVDIPDSVEEIGYHVFEGCTALTTVVIPDSVTTIYGGVFDGCTSLTDVTLPEYNWTVLPYGMFAGCTALTDAVIPAGVMEIEQSVFEGCTSLAAAEIPDGVETIMGWAFYGCSALAEMWIPSSVETIESDAFDGCTALLTGKVHVYPIDGEIARVKQLLEDSGLDTTNIEFADDMIEPEYKSWVDGDGVRWFYHIIELGDFGDVAEICSPTGDAAIPTDTAGDITVPDMLGGYNMASLGVNAFAGCELLTGVTLPDTLQRIESHAFAGCEALESITVPGDAEPIIGVEAFKGCKSLKSATLEWGVREIGESAFAGCEALESVDITDEVTRIGDSAFEDCTALESVTIPASATVGQSAFSGCTALETLIIEEGVTNIGAYAFEDCDSLTSVEIPGTVEFVDKGAFLNCDALAELTISDGVERFDGAVFAYCPALTTVTIPNSVVDFGVDLFLGCDGLQSVIFEDGVDYIGESMFYDCDALTDVVIPDSVTTIGAQAFYDCESLTSIRIPESVTSIGDEAFVNSSLKTVFVGVDEGARVKKMFDDSGHDTSGMVFEEDLAPGFWVYFEPNGGGVTEDKRYVLEGDAVGEFPAASFDGYTLAGWFTDAFGGYEVTEDWVPTADTKVYAHWSEVVVSTKWTVTFNGNGGVAAEASRTVEDGEVVGALPSATREGWTLEGWFSTDEAGEEITADTVVTEDMEIFAHWIENETPPPTLYCTVTFDANGGSVPEATRTVLSGDEVGELPVATKAGYFSFDGWFTAPTGGSIIDETTEITSDVTFFAHWTEEADGWFKTKADAMAEAARTGKKVFLICGRETCAKTMATKADCSEPSTRAKLEEKCVLWYSNCDTQYEETMSYVDGLGEFPLPLVCIIDPATPDAYVKRSTDRMTAAQAVAFVADVPAPKPPMWTVIFDAEGGESSIDASTVQSDTAIGELPTATREGYTFLGWFTTPTGGTQVFASTKVTSDVTYYAHWTENGGGEGGKPWVEPEIEPTPCYEWFDIPDVTEPYSAPSAVLLHGALYDGCEVVGIVELKLGKVKKMSSKIAGSVTLLDGKKHSIKAVTVKLDGASPAVGYLQVKGIGIMHVAIGGNRFAGTLPYRGVDLHVQSAPVCKAWGGKSATASVEMDDLSMFSGMVLTELLPYSEVADINNGKWKFRKAAGVKWSKPKKGAVPSELYDPMSGKDLLVDVSKGKTNLSAMKLSYAPKKGTFKGSFKLYALQGEGKGRKLKKYTVKVSGVVVDDVGYGIATCKKPAMSWAVTVK